MRKKIKNRIIYAIVIFIVILTICIIINKTILTSYYKYRAYYSMNVSNSASYDEFLYYVRKLQDCSTEVELKDALLNALDKKSHTYKEIALLALAGKDSPQAHKIFEELSKNNIGKNIALRGLSKCQSYNQKQLFRTFASDNKAIEAIVGFQMLENRTDTLDDILQFYLSNVEDNDKKYICNKVKKYLLKHKYLICKSSEKLTQPEKENYKKGTTISY